MSSPKEPRSLMSERLARPPSMRSSPASSSGGSATADVPSPVGHSVRPLPLGGGDPFAFPLDFFPGDDPFGLAGAGVRTLAPGEGGRAFGEARLTGEAFTPPGDAPGDAVVGMGRIWECSRLGMPRKFHKFCNGF